MELEERYYSNSDSQFPRILLSHSLLTAKKMLSENHSPMSFRKAGCRTAAIGLKVFSVVVSCVDIHVALEEGLYIKDTRVCKVMGNATVSFCQLALKGFNFNVC